MFARVDLKVGIRPDAILVPMDALTRLEELQYVYVVKDGKALQVPVEVGGRLEALVEITKGLTGDEQVIVSGKDLVTTGKPVLATPLSRGGAPPPKDPSPKPRPKS
jgi:membrane fusion protein (multidrug efflux system)